MQFHRAAEEKRRLSLSISDQLVLKASADIAFAKVSEDMLRDKEQKEKRKAVEQIEAER